jgi:hypothetical protein
VGRSAAKQIEFADADDWYSSPTAALGAYKRFADSHFEVGASWVRIVGEPVWLGRSAAEVRRWAAYESLLNLVFESSAVTVLCPYDRRALPAKIVRQAHRTHPQIMDGAGTTASADYSDPSSLVLGDS